MPSELWASRPFIGGPSRSSDRSSLPGGDLLFGPRAPVLLPPELLPADPRSKGQWGEDRACRYLESLGWTLIGRNLREGHGELDILCQDCDVLVVVEVRLRTVGKVTPPGESVGPRKLRALVKTGYRLIRRLRWQGAWRIDLVALTVRPDRVVELEHFEDITAGMIF